jgi:hypothetical protein
MLPFIVIVQIELKKNNGGEATIVEVTLQDCVYLC